MPRKTKLVKDMTDDELDTICNDQESCTNCPLLLAKKVEDDPTYDYHATYLCYKKYAKKIKAIQNSSLEV